MNTAVDAKSRREFVVGDNLIIQVVIDVH